MDSGAPLHTWGMHDKAGPLFAEYLKLCHAAGWNEVVSVEKRKIGKGDALVVVDLQNDFVPCDDVNPEGGAFGVAEGAHTSPLIVHLMQHFGASGGLVIATRDYHPMGHCSWIENGGPFPRHCLQGSVGSYFYKPIGDCLQALKKMERRAEVVFKGYHEDIDSFGSFEYPEADAKGRLCMQDNNDRLYGCSLCEWTGCQLLKCSNLDCDVNAPPDVMAVLGRKTLKDSLKEQSITRVFVCGLAMDFCVLDTCLNAAKAGFKEVFMVMDAARAAYLPGIGTFGSGFLSDPKEVKDKMKATKVKVVPTGALAAFGFSQNPLKFASVGQAFPGGLGPFALVQAHNLRITVNMAKLTFTAESPKEELKSLARYSIEPTGHISPPTPLTLPREVRVRLGLPLDATKFAWAYPLGSGKMTDQQRGYFSITTPSAAFFMFGGYAYLDNSNHVKAVFAVAIGEGLSFGKPGKWKSEYSAALKGRWQPVTAPFLKQAGVKKFAWINPDEELMASGGGQPWKVCAHGAFAYLFHDDESASDPNDVVFSVSTEGGGKQKVPLGRLASCAEPSPGKEDDLRSPRERCQCSVQ